jgi:hypothetical protein
LGLTYASTVLSLSFPCVTTLVSLATLRPSVQRRTLNPEGF